MPEPVVVKREESKSASADSCEQPVPASVPVQPPATVETPEHLSRTAELLKQWPAVVLAIQKSKDAYCSVKHKSGIISWSLNLTEKAVCSVLTFVGSKASSLRPVIQYADKAVSEGVVVIEKKFPAVRESPEKIYDAIMQQLTKIVRPAIDKTEAISEIGRKKLDRVAKTMTTKYHSFIRSVDSWMDKLEKNLNGADFQAAPGAEAAVAEPAAEAPAETPNPTPAGSATPAPPAGRVRQALRLGARVTTALAAFQVGAAFWLLSRAPLVGRFFREAPVPASSESSSSSGAPLATLPTLTVSEAEQPPLSTDSQHPEQ
ncbi:uncharacterized protein LOC126115036 [Schistocerca cancellata]|uniref:uncharacterized protein LOC126115036 n=1 Tax=Schistocerca cancellata TaxID=274614 RepID=UPI0021183192|nr:uncharacterized protein LOC126115036 [Schistocerca cancellata]